MQICKPYFLKCKQSKDISKCFQDVYYKCVPQVRERFFPRQIGLGCAVLFLNPYPISDQNLRFPYPISDLPYN